MSSPNQNHFSSNFTGNPTHGLSSSGWSPAAAPHGHQNAGVWGFFPWMSPSPDHNTHNTAAGPNQPSNVGYGLTRPGEAPPYQYNFYPPNWGSNSSWLHPNSANRASGAAVPSTPIQPPIASVEHIGALTSATSVYKYLDQFKSELSTLALDQHAFKDHLKTAHVVKSGREGLYFLQCSNYVNANHLPVPLGSIVVKNGGSGYLLAQTFGILCKSFENGGQDRDDAPTAPDLRPIATEQIAFIVEKLFELQGISEHSLVIKYNKSTIQPLGAWASADSGEKWPEEAWTSLLRRLGPRVTSKANRQELIVSPKRD